MLDITERKKAKESLRLTQFVVDKAPIGIWKMGAAGEVLDVNEQGCASLGYSKEALCRMSVLDFYPNFDTEAVWIRNREALEKLGATTIESQHRCKNGDVVPIEVIQNLIRFEDQEFHVAFVLDITHRKRAEAALRENDRLLANILESMNEGILVLDHELRYQIFNTAMEVFTNTPKQAILGKRPWDVFDFIQGSVVEENMRNTMRVRMQGAMEIQRSLPHKHHAWFRESFTPLKDTDGQIVGVIEVVSDITRKKQGEEEVRRLRSYLANFIITENHGGQMNAHAAEGGGTCFVIRLPKGGGETG